MTETPAARWARAARIVDRLRGAYPDSRCSLDYKTPHQLLVTGGSDWHGKGKPNKLGENLTDEATVEEIVHRGVLPLYR